MHDRLLAVLAVGRQTLAQFLGLEHVYSGSVFWFVSWDSVLFIPGQFIVRTFSTAQRGLIG